MRKKIFIVVFIIIVLVVGWKLYQDIISNESATNVSIQKQRGTRSIPVEVENIESGIIKDIGHFTGTLNPNSRIIISPKISGRLKKIYFNAGDIVKKGDLIAEIEDMEYRYQFEQVKAELEISKVNCIESKSALDLAKKDFNRAKDLFNKLIMSTSEFDIIEHKFKIAEAKYESAKYQVELRKASLKLAELKLSYTKIYAEWEEENSTRIIAEKFIDEGNIININSPLVSIFDNNILKASVYISENDYFKISKNDRAIILNSMIPENQFEGYVYIIEPFLKENIRQGRIEILLKNIDNILKPGMFVNVLIEYESKDNATIVPFNSLVKRNEKDGVFLVNKENNIANFIPVDIGFSQDDKVEILSPANLSGQVITLGHHLVDDGTQINIVSK
jgi:RND family efflux transporter MFP subunit